MTILIWGTGGTTARLLSQLSSAVKIAAFIETIPSREQYAQCPVISPDAICQYPHDLVVVASIHVREILRHCDEQGIQTGKFVNLFHSAYMKEIPNRLDLLRPWMDEAANAGYQEGYHNRFAPVWRMAADQGPEGSYFDRWEPMQDYFCDYTRYRTLELLCREISDRQVAGEVAEAGVFRGDFARAINYLFPERTCHLFDTFESFDPAEFSKEHDQNRVTVNVYEGFRDTTQELVLDKMPHPQQCVFHPGLFPQTAQGMENHRFALVSLDMDLEDSIYAGLCFFYPRLSSGGYILVHDYTHRLYQGVREAVKRYEEQTGEPLIRCPISDQGGTLILCKP